MVATKITHPKTYEDYLKTPDDGQRYELIDGEIVVSASPILVHQTAVLELAVIFRAFVKLHALGKIVMSPMDVRLAPDIVVQPDFCFVRKGSAADNPNEERIAGSPDVMVEVLSPSNPGHDLVRKRELYARYDVPEYWIVDPLRRTITALTLTGGRYVEIPQSNGVLASKTLAGLEVNLDAYFASVYS
jgi:Uma2 family endonuclease